MIEKFLELIKVLRPERFPIVLIVGLILYAIIDQNANPYRDQHSKLGLIKEIKVLSTDTSINRKVNVQLNTILESANKTKEIEPSMIVCYIGVSLLICLFVTIWGFLYRNKERDWGDWGVYILGLITLVAPVTILSFIFDYYVINNHYVTLGITAIMTFVLVRVHNSINKAEKSSERQP